MINKTTNILSYLSSPSLYHELPCKMRCRLRLKWSYHYTLIEWITRHYLLIINRVGGVNTKPHPPASDGTRTDRMLVLECES